MSWFFQEPDHAFHSPTFLQAGQDFAQAEDEYAYVYSPREDQRRRNDHLDLARVRRDRIRERGAYEFFAGVDGTDGGAARWTRDAGSRAPILGFAGHAACGDVVFVAALRRYLLVTCASWESVAAEPSALAFFDAPHPWGPWTAAGYVPQWGTGQNGDCRYDPRLPANWISLGERGGSIGAGELACTLVYSDRRQSDTLQYQRVRFDVLEH
jgi:hypothetical protein